MGRKNEKRESQHCTFCISGSVWLSVVDVMRVSVSHIKIRICYDEQIAVILQWSL